MDPSDEFYPICLSLTDQGRPCHARPRLGGDYCIHHDPSYAAQQAANRALGNQRSAEVRAARETAFAAVPVDLTDRAAIQAALDVVMRLNLSGQISEARSRQLLRALSIAARNFDTVINAGRVFHPQERYTDARQGLLTSIATSAEREATSDVTSAEIDPPQARPAASPALSELESLLRLVGQPLPHRVARGRAT